MAIFRRFTRKKTGDSGAANGTSEVKPSASTPSQQETKSVSKAANGTSSEPAYQQPAQPAKPAESAQHIPEHPSVPEEPEQRHKLPTESEVNSTFADLAQLVHASLRPLPNQTADGTYIEKEENSGIWADIRSLGLRDVKTIRQIMTDKASGLPQDDRKMHMEDIMKESMPGLVAALPTHSKTRIELTVLFLDELWNSLEHPPQSYLGDKYQYRSADGSNNNYCLPLLGAANTPMRDRSILLQSNQHFFNWASLIIHDLFQTDHHDYSISKTSSYLDLSILYGDTQEDQDQMRTFKDGKIKPDCFAEERLLVFPPACGVMLIMLNRFHNYVVETLALINENGRFKKPNEHMSEEQKTATWKKYDNDLFQTGRLVTCGLYINITLYDYLRTIVNLNRMNTTWTLDPRLEKPRHMSGPNTPRGLGNQVSAEFSLSYRWHSCIGQQDELFTENLYKELFDGKSADQVDLPELMKGLGKFEKMMPKDPLQRPFARLKRGADGKFPDDDLAKIMTDGIEEVSGAFGARNIPKCLRAVSILGMEQARAWNLGTLNEFRKFFDLKTYDTFEEINPDKYVAEQLRNLYEHPDYVELYPGIASEAAKVPTIPGVGIAPTYTISRAVLSDAVALVRGDRFYTVDYNAKNLTNWGYNEVRYDLSVNQGCVFYKLLLRALPNHFEPNSIYAHYPMTIPQENAKIMKDLGRYHDYSYTKPEFIPLRVNLTSYAGAQYVLNRAQDFTVMWNEGLGSVMGPEGLNFCLGGDSQFHRQQKETMSKALYIDKYEKHVKHFYEYITLRLLHEKSCKIAGINQVDIVRDVTSLAHVHFASNIFALPLKTAENLRGIFTESQMYMLMCVIFTAIFFDFEPTKSFPLRMAARKLSTMLGKLIEANIKTVTATSFVAKFVDSWRENHNALADYGIHMIRRLTESGLNPQEIAFSQILPTAIAMVPNQSQVSAQIIDFYLGEGLKHWPHIQELAKVDSPENDDLLLHYCFEGIRLNGTFGSYRRSEVSTTIDDNGKSVEIKPRDKVFISFVGAARDPKVFPDPDQVKLDRPIESYVHYGVGEHTCLGKRASMIALTAILRTVGKLENFRRAPGPQGQMKKLSRPGGFYTYMTADNSSPFVFPTTMKVHYDGTLPPLPVAVAEH